MFLTKVSIILAMLLLGSGIYGLIGSSTGHVPARLNACAIYRFLRASYHSRREGLKYREIAGVS